MRLTVAETHEAVGLRGFRLDYDKRYLRVQYNETVDRTSGSTSRASTGTRSPARSTPSTPM